MNKEDLQKQIELLVKDDERSQQTIINQRQEIERLTNIISELEKWLEERLDKLDINGYDDDVFNGIELALHKLQELKGSEKE